jgi:glutathione synthase/RimK-type ligase-like ATP-grasp enzyme
MSKSNAKDIIIITDEIDAHADRLIIAMKEFDVVPIRLNYNDIPNNVNVNHAFYSNGKNSIELKTNNKVIELRNIKSIWWRKPEEFHSMPEISVEETAFIRNELQQFLQGLWFSTDCYWVSRPDAIRQASRKPEQLQRAIRFGFRIPKTLMSNDIQEISRFYKLCNGNMIYKVFTDPYVYASYARETNFSQQLPSKITRTTLITPEILKLMNSTFLGVCQFQEYIAKKVEIRVTVIKDHVFAAEIHSQEANTTKVDWRNYEIDIPYQEHQLPTNVEQTCIRYIKSYGLEYGAIDLILTPENEYVFLENNPNGQFMFIEEKVPSLKMTRAMIDALIIGRAGTP